MDTQLLLNERPVSVLLNGININLNEMKVSLFFVENGISYTLQLSFISRKCNGFPRKKKFIVL